jgi:hypothetical protein
MPPQEMLNAVTAVAMNSSASTICRTSSGVG